MSVLKRASSMLHTMSCAVPARQNAADAPPSVWRWLEPHNRSIEAGVSTQHREHSRSTCGTLLVIRRVYDKAYIIRTDGSDTRFWSRECRRRRFDVRHRSQTDIGGALYRRHGQR